MNKRGFLLGEFTLKTIIAVLSLSLLIYLLFGLYSTFQGSKEEDEAKATLSKVVEIIHSVETIENYVLLGPSDWSFFYFEKNGPSECRDSCLCLCGKSGIYFINRKSDCDTKGICEKTNYIDLEKEIEIFGPEEPVEIVISKEGVGEYAIQKK